MTLIDAAKVRRWHNKPIMPIQTTGDHSFNMLLCLIALHPAPSANLMQAVIRHDLAERISGDFPHEMKREHPVLKEIDEAAQKQFEEENGLYPIELTIEERIWLKLLDQLEVMTYIESVIPFEHDETVEIFENCSDLASEYIAQLQTFGYFTEADSIIH